MESIKTTCDICKTIVDGDPSGTETFDMKNYTVIDIGIHQRNPKKRRKFSNTGSLVVCTHCLSKVMEKMSLQTILNKIAESVAEE